MKTVETTWGTWNEKQFLLLRQEYRKAVKDNKEQFTIEGQIVLTKFAKYLLQYLSPKFGYGDFTE